MAELKRHMGEAGRLWSEASCDSRTTAIYDCRLDPGGVPQGAGFWQPFLPAQPSPKSACHGLAPASDD